MSVFGQKATDTTQKVKVHSPKKAAWMSAVLPGLGQAYNKKYWKIPIVYAGLGTATYFLISNIQEYNKISNHYRFLEDSSTGRFEPEYALLGLNDEELIRSIARSYQTNYEWSGAAFILVYALNIVDAMVDGYLYNFDVSKNLKGSWEPQFNLGIHRKAFVGAKITLRF